MVFSNRDKRTLPKKMAVLLEGLCIKESCYFVADAYYACKTTIRALCRRSFGSWIRTIRMGILPSEMVVAIAMRNTVPEFLVDSSGRIILTEFMADKIDLGWAEGLRMVA